MEVEADAPADAAAAVPKKKRSRRKRSKEETEPFRAPLRMTTPVISSSDEDPDDSKTSVKELSTMNDSLPEEFISKFVLVDLTEEDRGEPQPFLKTEVKEEVEIELLGAPTLDPIPSSANLSTAQEQEEERGGESATAATAGAAEVTAEFDPVPPALINVDAGAVSHAEDLAQIAHPE